jgi:hypothetical protein
MSSDLQIRKFRAGFEALGLVIDFVASDPPFGTFRAAKLLKALKNQLANGYHVAGFEGERLVAYCGWLTTSTAQGEAWLQGEGQLKAIAPPAGDAVALTIVRVLMPEHVLPMLRACRNLNRGKRVFFKREYSDLSGRARKRSVVNRD